MWECYILCGGFLFVSFVDFFATSTNWNIFGSVVYVKLQYNWIVILFVGLATSFFNDKNRSLARDLIELLIESKQDVPQWLETLAVEDRHSLAQRKTPIRRLVELSAGCILCSCAIEYCVKDDFMSVCPQGYLWNRMPNLCHILYVTLQYVMHFFCGWRYVFP